MMMMKQPSKALSIPPLGESSKPAFEKRKSMLEVHSSTEFVVEDLGALLAQVDQAEIFRMNPTRIFPAFTSKEIKLGAVLGVGGFGVVREVTNIHLLDSSIPGLSTLLAPIARGSSDEDDSPMENNSNHHNHHITTPGATTTTQHPRSSLAQHRQDSLTDGFHYDARSARSIMKDRCIRNGESRYAVKKLMIEDLNVTEIMQGRLDLAIEVKFLQVLDHPNIIRMRGIQDTSDPLNLNFFFIMDRLLGTLAEKIVEWEVEKKKRKGGLFRKSDKEYLNFLLKDRLMAAYDVQSAFKYIHSRKLVYRDIKPENIGFDIRGDIKVFDFGMTKSLCPKYLDQDGLYNLTMQCGSCRYMAPEVFLFEPYNEKCDVFSYGILLWEMLALKRAFMTLQTKNDCLKKIARQGVRPKISGKWSSNLKALLKTCWDRKISNRPSMEEIGVKLTAELESMRLLHLVTGRHQMLAAKSLKSMMLDKQQLLTDSSRTFTNESNGSSSKQCRY